MICFFSPELDFWNMQKRYIPKLFCREIFCPKRSKHGCLHDNPPNPSFGWITKKRSFSSELNFALKGWGERGQSIFLIYKICFVGRFAYFYPFLTTILTPPARPKIMSCLKGKGLKFMGFITAFFVQLFFLIK